MLRCTSQRETDRTVESASSTKVYRVRVFLPDGEPWTCDCVSFAINRNREGGKNHGGTGWCKHLEAIRRETCVWTSDELDSPTRLGGLDFCPRCGLEVFEASAIVLPESEKAAVAAVTDKLLAILDDLRKDA